MKIALIILLVILVYYYISNMHLVTISLPGRGEKYMVSNLYGDEVESAKLMSKINDNIIGVLRHMKNKYIGSNSYPSHLVQITENMLYNYNPEVIIENVPGGGDTSYTINKGKRMYICIRDFKGRRLDPHTITFVVLHELSHIGHYYGWGHGQSYWEVFKFVLKEAEESGFHYPIDYSLQPIKYCGISITYNPYFDTGIKNIEQIQHLNI
jgi:hypothetical protein